MSPREYADTNLKHEQERAAAALRKVQYLEQVVHHLPDWLQVDYIYGDCGYKANCSVKLLPVETREEAIALAMKLNPVPLIVAKDNYTHIVPADDAPDKAKCREWIDDILPYYMIGQVNGYKERFEITFWADYGRRVQFHIKYRQDQSRWQPKWRDAYPPRDRYGDPPPPDFYVPYNHPPHRREFVFDCGKMFKLVFAKPKEPEAT